jgi:hypothetical protein
LADEIETGDDNFRDYLEVSSQYGLIKYSIIQQGWIIMLKGTEGDITGIYEEETIRDAIRKYDKLWDDFRQLKAENPDCATLYMPYSFVFEPPAYHEAEGMKTSVDRYREIAGM